MKSLVEKYTNMILKKYTKFNPTVVTYGSNCYGDNNNDLDVCIIMPDDFDMMSNVIEDTIDFSRKNGLTIDEEIPYFNKLIYTYEQIEQILMESVFINKEGVYCISDIVKTKDFLYSEEMRSRLLLNILTTEHCLMCGDKVFVDLCKEKAWLIILDAVTHTYQLGKKTKEEQYMELLYKNPYTGAEGEWYLGYKRHYSQKDIYLRKNLHKYLGVYRNKKINLSENVNPYFPTFKMLTQAYKQINVMKEYPENRDITLRKKIASLFGLNEDYIMVTNGAMEAIHIIIDKYLLDEAAIIQPSFWGYYDRLKILNRKYHSFEVKDNYLSAIRKACEKYNYVIICNPNTPTLDKIEMEDVESLLYDYPHCTLIIDETILVFENDYMRKTAIRYTSQYDNLIVITSLSKISGMSGLRCGFIAANKKIINSLLPHRALYCSNSICQKFFCEHVEEIIKNDLVKEMIRKNFVEFIDMLDKSYVSSICIGGSFILVEFSHYVDLEEIKKELVNNNIYIQYLKCIYPQLQGNWVRISAGTRADFIALVKLLNCYMEKINVKIKVV